MTTLTPSPLNYSRRRLIWAVASREARDTLRDWRLVIPILGLTLLFPGLMTIVASRMVIFLDTYNSQLIGDRALPLLLMVVGFFPTSFSLVIALEAFVGEKERKSLEPLLATPLSNLELYIGKLIAAVVPPVLASYIGIALYTIGVTFLISPMDTQSVVLVIVLTTIQAILMVAASVVVSSQTTSVRAANMLASFIIVPVALLLQFEALLMAFEYYGALWWIVLGVFITGIIFTRIGVQQFDRERLLGRNLDFLRFGWAFRYFWRRFTGRMPGEPGRGIGGWYRQTWGLIPTLRLPSFVLLGSLVLAAVIGVVVARAYPLPEDMLSQIRGIQMQTNVVVIQEMLAQLPLFIFSHNIRAILLVVILGSMSFGVLAILMFMLPWGVIAFVAAQFATVGESPLVFLSATILPHAWVELPALLLVTAAALRWQAILIAPPGHRTMGEQWLAAGADFARIFVGFGIPLFLFAALLESFLTPAIMVWVYG